MLSCFILIVPNLWILYIISTPKVSLLLEILLFLPLLARIYYTFIVFSVIHDLFHQSTSLWEHLETHFFLSLILWVLLQVIEWSLNLFYLPLLWESRLSAIDSSIPVILWVTFICYGQYLGFSIIYNIICKLGTAGILEYVPGVQLIRSPYDDLFWRAEGKWK